MDCCSSHKKEHSDRNQNQRRPGRLALFGAIIVLAALGGGLGWAFTKNKSVDSAQNPKIAFEHSQFNAGNVSMANGVYSHIYKFKNNGKAALKISKIETTCMCTTAKIRYKGEDSEEFGMPGHGNAAEFWSGMEIAPGGEAELVVDFDPNAHGPNATGYIKRGIFLETDDPGKKKATIYFSGTVIK